MSAKKGLLTTCDRCGAETFREYIGQGDADGGYTKWDKFKPLPDNWMYASEVGTLCPRCAGLFRVFIHKLMDEKKIAPAWSLREGDGDLIDCVIIKEKNDDQT